MRLIAFLWFLIFSAAVFAQEKASVNPIVKVSFSEHKQIVDLNKKAFDIFLTYPDTAREMVESALVMAEKANDSIGKGRCFLNLGIIYWSQSYYPVSLFFLKSAMPFLRKDSPLSLSHGYNSLARTYANLKDYKTALMLLDSSLYYAGNDVAHTAEVYSQRAFIYTATNNFDKAETAARFALKLNRSVNEVGNVAVLYSRLATIYRGKNDLKRALAYNDTAFTLSIQIKNRRLESFVYLDYALINNALGNYDAGIGFAQKAILLSNSMEVIDAQTKSYNALVKSYELKGEIKKALFYQNEFNTKIDSLSNENNLKTLRLVHNYFDLNSKIQSIDAMQASDKVHVLKIRSQRVLIAILVLSLVILTAILTATRYFYKQKELLNQRLQQQRAVLLEQKKLTELQAVNLQEINSLKDKILAVIGHDLQSPIANLSSMVAMFEGDDLTESEVRSLMKGITPVVKGAEITLANLTEWAGSQIKGQSVDISAIDLFALGQEMQQTFEHALEQKQLRFNNDALQGEAALADKNHVKIVLRNLISNAIKFTHDAGEITLLTTVTEDQLTVSVKDTGQGMEAVELSKLFHLNTHFSNTGTSGEKGTGLGLILCKELVELNSGKLIATSVPGEGSTFYFNLKRG